MTNASTSRAGRRIILLVAGLITLFNAGANSAADAARWNWEAVESEFVAGKPVRLDVRVTGAAFQAPATIITVTSARLDMGLDGMAEMTAPVRAVGSFGGNTFVFETEFSMTGRWALTITADVAGERKPITGMVIFTAIEKRALTDWRTETGQLRAPAWQQTFPSLVSSVRPSLLSSGGAAAAVGRW